MAITGIQGERDEYIFALGPGVLISYRKEDDYCSICVALSENKLFPIIEIL